MDVNAKANVRPPTPKIKLLIDVNGDKHQLHVAPTARLLDILREDLGLTGTKFSCEIGRCGTCAIHMNGRLVNSCLVMAYQAKGAAICTIEGLAGEDLHPIQKAFLECGGFQCGYCTPGMIMSVKAMLDEHPQPTQEQIQDALSGNLCRCTGYGGIIRAVERVIDHMNTVKSRRLFSIQEVISIQEVNQMSKEEFLSAFGKLFEHSPWVAEKSWFHRPFSSKEALFKTMVISVQKAEQPLQLALLRAHPDLGSKLMMSEVSKQEQAGVGLDQLSQVEFNQFSSTNQAYVKKFGFPFIMAVKGQKKESIYSSMKKRLNNTLEEENVIAMNEVFKIARFRLDDLIEG
jgi:xanthine dehydrogenase E subunit